MYELGGRDAWRQLARGHHLGPGPYISPFIPKEAVPGDESSTDDEPPPDVTGRWLKRAGQIIWRTMGVHINKVHANTRRGDCRITCADLIGLGLREYADMITGDWNQAGSYLA